jgi:hypothetical protein
MCACSECCNVVFVVSVPAVIDIIQNLPGPVDVGAESIVGTTIFTVNAFDPYANPSAAAYSIVSQTPAGSDFAIHATSGMVSLHTYGSHYTHTGLTIHIYRSQYANRSL